MFLIAEGYSWRDNVDTPILQKNSTLKGVGVKHTSSVVATSSL